MVVPGAGDQILEAALLPVAVEDRSGDGPAAGVAAPIGPIVDDLIVAGRGPGDPGLLDHGRQGRDTLARCASRDRCSQVVPLVGRVVRSRRVRVVEEGLVVDVQALGVDVAQRRDRAAAVLGLADHEEGGVEADPDRLGAGLVLELLGDGDGPDGGHRIGHVVSVGADHHLGGIAVAGSTDLVVPDGVVEVVEGHRVRGGARRAVREEGAAHDIELVLGRHGDIVG